MVSHIHVWDMRTNKQTSELQLPKDTRGIKQFSIINGCIFALCKPYFQSETGTLYVWNPSETRLFKQEMEPLVQFQQVEDIFLGATTTSLNAYNAQSKGLLTSLKNKWRQF